MPLERQRAGQKKIGSEHQVRLYEMVSVALVFDVGYVLCNNLEHTQILHLPPRKENRKKFKKK